MMSPTTLTTPPEASTAHENSSELNILSKIDGAFSKMGESLKGETEQELVLLQSLFKDMNLLPALDVVAGNVQGVNDKMCEYILSSFKDVSSKIPAVAKYYSPYHYLYDLFSLAQKALDTKSSVIYNFRSVCLAIESFVAKQEKMSILEKSKDVFLGYFEQIEGNIKKYSEQFEKIKTKVEIGFDRDNIFYIKFSFDNLKMGVFRGVSNFFFPIENISIQYRFPVFNILERSHHKRASFRNIAQELYSAQLPLEAKGKHPFISSGESRLCTSSFESNIRDAFYARDIFAMAFVLRKMLSVYNDGETTPYTAISSFYMGIPKEFGAIAKNIGKDVEQCYRKFDPSIKGCDKIKCILSAACRFYTAMKEIETYHANNKKSQTETAEATASV